MRILDEPKTKKSAACDGFKAETLKVISGYIHTPLTYIINKSLYFGFLRAAIKSSIVTVYKSGDEKKVTNYRPISLSNIIE